MLNFDFSGIANLRENPLSLEDFGIDPDLAGTPIALGFTPIYSISPGSGATTLTSGIENYQKSLNTGADYFKIDDVDKVDDFYDNQFTSSIMGMTASPSDYLAQVDSPQYLSNFNAPPTREDVADAWGKILIPSNAADTAAALSEHYGYVIQPKDQSLGNFGGNLGTHTSSSKEQLEEFHSLVEPILEEQIPFLQVTEGLSYQDALLESYNRDPMLQALYQKYGVTPVRQTKDGSTYLYDPFSYSEIRTVEVKDTGVQDALKAVAIMVATAGAGSALGGYLAASTSMSVPLANAVGSAIASAGATAATGGDTSDILRSAVLAGAGGYAEGLEQVAEASQALAGAGAFSAQSGQLAAEAAKAAKDLERFNNVVKTAKFVDAAVNDDVLGGLVNLYGKEFTGKALDKLGLDQETLDAKYGGIQRDDMTAGLVKMQQRLAGGAGFEDALMDGFGTYIREGGTLGFDVDTPEFIEQIGDAIKEAGRQFDDSILQPPKEVIEALLSSLPDKTPEQIKAIEDYVRTVGSKAEDVARETVAVVDEPIQEAGQAVAEVAQEVKEQAEEVYEQVELPTGTTPEAGSMGFSGVDADLGLDMPNLDFTPFEVSESMLGDYKKQYTTPGLLQRRKLRAYTTPGMFRGMI